MRPTHSVPLPTVVRELLSGEWVSDDVRPRQVRFEELVSRADATPRPFYAYSANVRGPLGLLRRADFLEVFAVARGRGCDVVVRTRSGARYAREAQEGQLYLFRPSDVTSLAVTSRALMTGLSVMIPVSVWDAYAAFVGIPEVTWQADEPPTATLDADADGLRPFVEAIDHSRGSPSRVDVLRFLIDVIPRLFPRPPSSAEGVAAPNWLVRSVEAMRGNEENLRGGVARLTELAHVTGQYLATSMRKYYGTTPSLFIRRLRLDRAAVLLTSSTLSVGEIADRCGYTSPSHFTNCFRDEYRISPRAFRARERPSA